MIVQNNKMDEYDMLLMSYFPVLRIQWYCPAGGYVLSATKESNSCRLIKI